VNAVLRKSGASRCQVRVSKCVVSNGRARQVLTTFYWSTTISSPEQASHSINFSSVTEQEQRLLACSHDQLGGGTAFGVVRLQG
jgi:hypothetical protein